MKEFDNLEISRGNITPQVDVPELVVRLVKEYGLTEELDGGYDADEPENCSFEYRLQGRIVNTSKSKLTELKYDVSYYDADGKFLGLTKSRFLDEDELDIDDQLPLDFKVDPPEKTATLKFNVRAKKVGAISKLFWG